MHEDILIVDDEPDIRALICLTLEDEGFLTLQAANAKEAREVISSRPPSCIVLDIWMRDSDMDGLELLTWCKEFYSDIPVLMISGHGNIETAVQAIRKGAQDFIEKPFKAERLILTVRRALQQTRLERENAELKSRAGASRPLSLIGQSSSTRQLRHMVDKVAATSSRVLITGSSGSGKQIVARLIHAGSDRHEGPFIVVHCARLLNNTADSELFGSELMPSGRRIVGLFEQAHRGTLYFDEIGDLPLDIQGRLVRAVAEQVFRRVGGTVSVSTDVRIISASSHDLAASIAQGLLREDLYYRLGVVALNVAPLSQRREDIGELAQHFVHECAEILGMPALTLGEDLLNALRSYDWPGSVRQLRNVIETIMILTDRDGVDKRGGVISVDNLPRDILTNTIQSSEQQQLLQKSLSLPIREAREVFDREYIKSQLSRFSGNITQMAKFIGMDRTTLHRKLKSWGIHTDPIDDDLSQGAEADLS